MPLNKVKSKESDIAKFLREKHKQIKPLKDRDNQSTPEEDFIIGTALFYLYANEAIKFMDLARTTFEQILEQSKSPYLEEFFESSNEKISESPQTNSNLSEMVEGILFYPFLINMTLNKPFESQTNYQEST